MAYEHEYLNCQGSYDNAFSAYVCVPTPLDTSSIPIASKKGQSFIIASSDSGSERSMMTSGPDTPPLHTHHGLPVNSFSTHQVATSLCCDGATSMVGFSTLGPLAEHDFRTAFKTPSDIGTKPASQWTSDDTVITGDTSLDLRFRHSPPAINTPATPQNHDARYSKAFYTSPPFLPSPNSIPDLSPYQNSTVSFGQIYHLPNALLLGPNNSTARWEDFQVDYVDPSTLVHQEKQTDFDEDKSFWPTQTVNSDTQMLEQKLESPEYLSAGTLVAPCSPKVVSRKSKQALPSTERRSRKACNKSSLQKEKSISMTFTRDAEEPCPYGCGSLFRRADHAKRHAKSQHGEDLFLCKICEYHLEVHPSNKHAQERLFNRLDNKRQHMINCHFTFSRKPRVTRLVDENDRLKPETKWLMDEHDLWPVWRAKDRKRKTRLRNDCPDKENTASKE